MNCLISYWNPSMKYRINRWIDLIVREDSLKIDLSIGTTIKLSENDNNDTYSSGNQEFVTDQKGSPIVNASVVIVGTKKGTVTDAEGKFSLLIYEDNDNASLEFFRTWNIQ